MTGRGLYAVLVRLHPRRFRGQFENQMLSTFDEVLRERGVVSLLIDATVSLLRQWILRPDNWDPDRRRAVLAGGGFLSLDEFRKQSDRLHTKAWRVNLAFLAACVVVIFSLPSVRSNGSNVVNAIASVTVAILWYFVRKYNGVAAQALQEEIDALDRRK